MKLDYSVADHSRLCRGPPPKHCNFPTFEAARVSARVSLRRVRRRLPGGSDGARSGRAASTGDVAVSALAHRGDGEVGNTAVRLLDPVRSGSGWRR
jgi:hypothetical protein